MKKILLAFVAVLAVSNCVKADDPDVVFLVGIFNDLNKEFPPVDSKDQEAVVARELQVQRWTDKFRSAAFSNPERSDYSSYLTLKVGDSPAVFVSHIKDSREILKAYFANHKVNYSLTEKIVGKSFSKNYDYRGQYKSHSDYKSSLIKLYRSSPNGGAPIPVASIEVWSVFSTVEFYRHQIDENISPESFAKYVGDVTLYEKDDQVLKAAAEAVQANK